MKKHMPKILLIVGLAAANFAAVSRAEADENPPYWQRCQWIKTAQGTCAQSCADNYWASCGDDPCASGYGCG